MAELVRLGKDYAALNPAPPADLDGEQPHLFLNSLWQVQPEYERQTIDAAALELSQFLSPFTVPAQRSQVLELECNLLELVKQIPELQPQLQDAMFVQELLGIGQLYAALKFSDLSTAEEPPHASFLDSLWRGEPIQGEALQQAQKLFDGLGVAVGNPKAVLLALRLAIVNERRSEIPELPESADPPTEPSPDLTLQIGQLAGAYAALNPESSEGILNFFLSTVWSANNSAEPENLAKIAQGAQELQSFLAGDEYQRGVPVEDQPKLLEFDSKILQSVRLASKLNEAEKKNQLTLKKFVRMGRAYASFNASPEVELEDPRLFLNTLWKTDDIRKGAEELDDFLATSDMLATQRVGPVTATIQVTLIQDVMRDETGQVTQPGQIQVQYLLPSQLSGRMQIEETFEYTGGAVSVPIYRSTEAGTRLETDGYGIPYSTVFVQHADGSPNTPYDFSFLGYPTIPLQPGDTIVVPTAELPISAPVDRMNYFEKLITAIELAQYEDSSPEVKELIEGIKANPALFLSATALFMVLQVTPVGIILDIIAALGFGVETAASLHEFFTRVGQAVDVQDLKEAGKAFNQFGGNLINTLLSVATVSELPGLLKHFDSIKAVVQSARTNLLPQVFQLINQLLTAIKATVEASGSVMRAVFNMLKEKSASVARFFQKFGNKPEVTKHFDEIEATSDLSKLDSLAEIAERLKQHPDIEAFLDNKPNLLALILKSEPELIDALTISGNLLKVNDQIFIHPDKLVELGELGALPDLLTTTRKLADVNGDFSQLDKATQEILNTKLSSSRGSRLRFDYQLFSEVDAVLTQLGLENHSLFQDIALPARARLFDWTRNFSRDPVLYQQATAFASSQNPSNIFDFVSYAEFYDAGISYRASQVVDQWRIRVNNLIDSGVDDLAAKQQTSQQMFGSSVLVSNIDRVSKEARKLVILNSGSTANPGIPTTETLNSVSTEYFNMVTAIGDRVGSSQINPSLSLADITQQIQELPQIKFANEPTAAYHALKHYKDLPPIQQKGDIFGDYFNAANQAIDNPMEGPTHTFSQFSSSQTLVFHSFPVEGKQLRAFVALTAEGDVTLLTYFP